VVTPRDEERIAFFIVLGTMVRTALAQLAVTSSQLAEAATHSGAKRPDFRPVNAKRGGADFECRIVADTFWDIFREQRSSSGTSQSVEPVAVAIVPQKRKRDERKEQNGKMATTKKKTQTKTKKKEKTAPTITVLSDLGTERCLTRRAFAELVLEIVLPEVRRKLNTLGPWRLASIRAAPGDSGWLWLTTQEHAVKQANDGRVACATCGTFVSSSTGGMAWHMKNAHQTATHADAHTAAVAASQAMVRWQGRGGADGGAGGAAAARTSSDQSGGGRLMPADMAAAQRNPEALRAALAEGRVKPLTPGMELCRSGDASALRRLIESGAWHPAGAVDRNGSTPLMWAAGGGHLECCRFLVETCGIAPHECARGKRARRGYRGRTPLHWAARNGHLDIVRWLVETHGEGDGAARCAIVNAATEDGTTAFCWAAWQGHAAVCKYLVSAGADPKVVNSYGCNAAMWACQGCADGDADRSPLLPTAKAAAASSLELCRYLLHLGLDFSLLNANGQGCLHKAAQRGNRDVCEWLLGPEVAFAANGAKVLGPNSAEGSRPSSLARFAGHGDLATWLSEKEAASASER
jgi:ankyrin repeat protein